MNPLPPQQILKEANALLIKDKLEEAIALLRAKINTKTSTGKDASRSLEGIQRDLRSSKMAYRDMLITRSEEKNARTKCYTILRDILGELGEKDLTHKPERKRIWVISQAPYLENIEALLAQININNPLPKIISTHDLNLEEIDWEELEMFLFDNRCMGTTFNTAQLEGEPKAQAELMQKTINALPAGKFMIHFGDFVDIVKNHRDKVHAANSSFSLHARIKEMQNFIDVYVKDI